MKKNTAILLILLLVALLYGCAYEQETYTKTDFCFDTSVSVTIYDKASNASDAEAILDETIALCRDYDDMLSRTREGSDIWNINHAGGEWTTVSDDTLRLIQSSLEYCELTGGEIDITIAPVKELWDFTQTEDIHMPATRTIAEALTHVDYHLIEISGNKIRLNDPEAAIDLGFIAKGYIADHIRSFLLEKEVKSALINLGGNIVTIGEKPDGSAYQIGIQEPFAAPGTYLMTVPCSDSESGAYSSVVTSGIYERCFEYNGKLYHHILDSSTGQPVQSDLASVTILCDTSLHADALSTTCLILGLERSITFIEGLEYADAIFITTDGRIIDTRE